jgi:hypothetical protein
MRAALLALLLTLTACARVETVYERRGTMAAEIDQDRRECRYDAVRTGAVIVHSNAFIQAAERGNAEDRVMAACMEARGYTVTRIRIPTT